MARAQKLANGKIEAGLPQQTFVLDNGAYSIKAGFAAIESISDTELLQSCEQIPNCIVRSRERKTYIAAQSNDIPNYSEAVFRRPMENGQLVNWEAEREIWEHSFFDKATASKKTYVADPAETTLLLAESPNTMPALQKNADEIIMEEWGFGGYLRTVGPSLNAYNDLHPIFENADTPRVHSSPGDLPMECLLVVDSGHSSSIITPCFQGRPIQRAVRRLDFGGKHLTNLLREVVSIRHFDLHQDTKIVNDIKEHVSFVSQDIQTDMEKTWKGNKKLLRGQRTSADAMDLDHPTTPAEIRTDYVLPNGVDLTCGYARPYDPSVEAAKKRKLAAAQNTGEIVMTLGNERFTIPEIIFNPADIGSKQPGLAECVVQSLSKLPPLVQATMIANTIVIGGNAQIPGFVDRLQSELRTKIKTEWPVRVRKLENAIVSTWLGGARFARNHRDVLQKYAATKAQYEEFGSGWLSRLFATSLALKALY